MTDFSNVKLVRPCMEYMDSYIQAIRDGLGDEDKLDIILANKEAHLEKLLETKATGMITHPDGTSTPLVPQIKYWLVDGKYFIGKFDFRTEITEALKNQGGHVGYEISPSYRSKGYATHGLSLMKDIAKQHGLPEILIDCKIENAPSEKVIIKNGGVSRGTLKNPNGHDCTQKLYRIPLS